MKNNGASSPATTWALGLALFAALYPACTSLRYKSGDFRCGLIHVYQLGSFHIEKRLTLPSKCFAAALTKPFHSRILGLKPSHSYGMSPLPHAHAGGSPVRSSWTFRPQPRARAIAVSQAPKSYVMF